MSEIHPTAHVDRRAELASDVVIGAFSYIGPGVVLGDGSRVGSHVTIEGPTIVGRNNRFYPQCVIGAAPQDLKYRGGPTKLIIGDDNTIRELVTIHRGTEKDEQSGGTTRIGNRCLLMVGCHVAHDAEIRNHVIVSNGVQIAGHCLLEDHCHIGGMSGMHHFSTIGRYAYVTGMTRVPYDVPPYCIAFGHEMVIRALNAEGLRRWDFSQSTLDSLKAAFRRLFRGRSGNGASNTVSAIEALRASPEFADPHVQYLVEFVHRQVTEGVHGRIRERKRTDVPADRGTFYESGRLREIALSH
ncbi:MAG: acyl-ACP--UDP-N-acetylglucosamine O-acyltransferase [Planctomycetia bacterium]|nr:MAG: acyl-ACP--UDP-N-acetylglucosamine O-acyltransferase [Planctomycetia bacterium]